ncbi:MAG: homocysteine S-methyltransferase family protein [Pseudomonadota bacterium]
MSPPIVRLPAGRPFLLDGGMGEAIAMRQLNQKGSPFWSGKALIEAPDVVRDLHEAFIAAGADAIITNTYGVVRSFMAEIGNEERFAELNRIAGELAVAARDAQDRGTLIAGSLPPLSPSYEPGTVGAQAQLTELYAEQADLLAPYVDFFIGETLTTIAETRAVAAAAGATGKPVWVGWTLHETKDGCLKDGTPVSEAAAAVAGGPVSVFLANCCSPEALTRGLPALLALGTPTGGYANTFHPIDPDAKDVSHRDDLDTEAYAAHVADWIQLGARIVGGCCGTMPEHIARVRGLIAEAA